jgi:multidrug transporter EmrE-like cation transporter
VLAAETSSTDPTFATYALILVSVGLGICGQICLRRGMLKVKGGFEGGDQKLAAMVKGAPWKVLKSVATNWQVLLGLFLYVASAASWLVVLADVPLGVAYPFVSITYIAVLLYDWKIDKSYTINAWNWVGVGAIVAGVLMISVGRM